MIKKVSSNTAEKATEDFYKLSIQVSLNGLSFCVLDTISNKIIVCKSQSFEKEINVLDLKDQLKKFLDKHKISRRTFSEVVVIHRNTLFSLVPKSLFIVAELPNYLKFNAKILAHDHIDFDEIESYDLVNVYVPFTSINNYVYDLYGEFEFRHTSTVIIHTLLNRQRPAKTPVCYVHISDQQMDIAVISQKRLLLYNSFNFTTPEDFLYYLLFTFEQLKLDTDITTLNLFGKIEEDDQIYELCYRYIRKVIIFVPATTILPSEEADQESIDFTVLSTL